MAATDFTIADVLAWARTKPADEQYDFCLPSSCAVAQFGRATNRNDLVGVGDLRDLPFEFSHELWSAAVEDPMTFGAFVMRLEKLCPETIIPKSDWLRADAYLTDIEKLPA